MSVKFTANSPGAASLQKRLVCPLAADPESGCLHGFVRMKPLLPILFLLSVSVAFAASGISVSVPAPASDEVLLSAIAEVETGNNPSQLGRDGERTRLQILPETWRRFSRMPHSAANRAETDRVARAYLAVIRRRIHERGLPETAFFIAAGWNAGADWRHLTTGTVSYAERVANIVAATAPPAATVPAAAKPVPVIPLNGIFAHGAMIADNTTVHPLYFLGGGTN
jgi:hypothetical protein